MSDNDQEHREYLLTLKSVLKARNIENAQLQKELAETKAELAHIRRLAREAADPCRYPDCSCERTCEEDATPKA